MVVPLIYTNIFIQDYTIVKYILNADLITHLFIDSLTICDIIGLATYGKIRNLTDINTASQY